MNLAPWNHYILCKDLVEHQVGNRYTKSGTDTINRVFGWERQTVLNVVECGYRNLAPGCEFFAADFHLFSE